MFAISLLVALVVPGTAAAHAELDVPTPANGATVDGTPTEVAGTFTQAMESDGSSLQLRDAAATVVATGGVDPADDQRLVIGDVPDLVPGVYEVRWTSLSAEDSELARGTWTFTVAAGPSPTPAPSPTATVTPSASASASPTQAPSPTLAPSPAPSASAGGGGPSAGTSDVLVPIVAALAIVLIAAGLLLGRRGRSGSGG